MGEASSPCRRETRRREAGAEGVAVQNSGRALPPLPSEPAGLLWILATRRNAWVEDLVVGTVVVYDWAYRPAGEASSKAGDDPSPHPAPSSTQG
jgi:hypothetical protein